MKGLNQSLIQRDKVKDDAGGTKSHHSSHHSGSHCHGAAAS
jgi:hypothetical protein